MKIIYAAIFIVLTVGVLVLLSGKADEEYSQAIPAEYREYEKNLEKLRKLCDEQTAKNTEGLTYEPVVGRLVGSKETRGSLAQPPDYYTIYMSFIDLNESYTQVLIGASEEEFKEKVSFLNSVVGEQDKNLENHTKETFGICAVKKDLVLSGAIDTFMEIK